MNFITYSFLLLGILKATIIASLRDSIVISDSSPKGSNLIAINDNYAYAPKVLKCPSNGTSFLRKANRLSDKETEWLKKRRKLVNKDLRKFILDSWKNFTNATEIVDKIIPIDNDSLAPKIGLAASGGSFRALFGGAGMLAAMDDRTTGSVEHGLGGLLQSSTYLAGLSGGAWLVGLLVGSDWISIQSIVNDMKKNDSIWDISHSLINGNASSNSSTKLFEIIASEVRPKKDAGFPISLTDYWGNMLAYMLFPGLPLSDAHLSVSDVRQLKTFQNAEMPFPLVLAEHRTPYKSITPLNSTVFEFNPFEMGSWDDGLESFTDVKYLGTNVSNGVPVDRNSCVVGFDDGPFVLGTSSSILTPDFVPYMWDFVRNGPMAEFFSKGASNDTNNVAKYTPNPFKNSEFASKTSLTESDSLFLVDGGTDRLTIPFIPLLQKERDLDVIFALDLADNNAMNWPNGTSLVTIYERQFSEIGKNIAFPPVPDVETFEKENLGQKITFFGCDENELKNLSHIPPLVVYIPNSEYSFASNISTSDLSYTISDRLSMIKNGFETATMGNLTKDSNFRGCIACAIAKRKQQRKNITLPKECNQCFSKYCWSNTAMSPRSIKHEHSS